MKPAPKAMDPTALVLAAALLVGLFKGPHAAALWLAGVWTLFVALLALLVGVAASLGAPRGVKVAIQFGTEGPLSAFFLALWGLATALAFVYLAGKLGMPLLWLPALSLLVVVLPGSGPLMLDEFVQSLLSRGAALAGGAALFLLPLFALFRPAALEVAPAALAMYLLVLEAYVVMRLRE